MPGWGAIFGLVSTTRIMSAEETSQIPGPDEIVAMGRDLGRQLAAMRQGACVTQHQMAKLIGYARGTLSAAESGRFDQARRFWEQCDDALDSGGQLVGRYDKIKGYRAAAREREANNAQAERDARLADWRWPRQPPALYPCVSDSDVHIWFTKDGITHCLIIPPARAIPEELAETLRALLA